MSRRIEPTPILRGRDAIRLQADVERVDNLMKNPAYKKRIEDYLNKCRDMYLKFMAKSQEVR